jgi:hypothetical protein
VLALCTASATAVSLAYFPNGESPNNVSDDTFPVVRFRVMTVVTLFSRLMVTLFSLEIAVVRSHSWHSHISSRIAYSQM